MPLGPKDGTLPATATAQLPKLTCLRHDQETSEAQECPGADPRL